MRLDFNILWVEDQQRAVEAQRIRIQSQIKKEGFRLQVKFAMSVEEAMQFLSSDIYGDHIDLVLMDYDLGPGAHGDDGLVEVRRLFSYKDIIFYSSQASDLPNLVATKGIQGVFCSTRDELTDTVEGVFESLVKKVLDIDHSRGIVMGATSDIDHYINDCLHKCFDQGDESLKKKTFGFINKRVVDKSKDFEKDAKSITSLTHISELAKYHRVYTSDDRLRLLTKVLEERSSNSTHIEDLIKYRDDTVPRRNLLAHVRVITDGFSRKLFDRDNKELTSNEMKSLRHELLIYQEFFEQLSENLSKPPNE